MKAFLLAAGYGSRLKPLTDTTPKCLVPVQGVPLLAWWLKLLKKHGVEEVLVNTHYLSEQVERFADKYNKENGYFIKTVFEEQLLGSGGTVRTNSDFVSGEDAFLICYADNLTDIHLERMWKAHRESPGILTMALFRSNHPEQCGIAETRADGKILEFAEKPQKPISNLANAGIYIADHSLLDYIPKQAVSDFGKDVLPKLTGRMYGYFMTEYLIDIGTIDNYQRAQQEWKHDYYQDTFSD